MNPRDCRAYGRGRCKSPENLLDEDIQNRVLSIMEEKGYGEQRICSHYLESDPMDPEVAEIPKSFTFMGQRFTVDSHVFSNVVFDRIIVDSVKIERMLPDPLDAMFVLGNNRALYHLQDELTTGNIKEICISCVFTGPVCQGILGVEYV